MKNANVIKRLFSFVLALLMVFSMMPQITLGASAVTMTGGEKLYLTPNANWKNDNARYAIYVFNSSNNNAWASMTKVAGETDLYEVTVPSGSWSNVIFCRMSPSATANNWNNKWNQTADLVYDGSKNHYTVKAGTWDKGGGTWSVYAPVGETEAPKDTETPAQTEAPKETTAPTEAPVYNDVTVYAINSMKWANIHAYVWAINPHVAWPGAAMTKTGETVNGFDVYSYTFPENNVNLIFNNNNGGSQLADYNVTADRDYFLTVTAEGVTPIE